ncbi:MAG TPA: tetratricopeptide repeat protein [Bacteroidia bacterium]|nr:tetratricopeptide repeat protein [Bacteroidia bacterium]
MIILSSCSTSKKVSLQKTPIKKKQLTEDQHLAVASAYYEATKKKILGDYDQALSLFLQCLSIDPTNAAASYEMADILEYDKQPDTALIFSRRAVLLEPTNVWYQDLYAQCLQEKGKYKEVAGVYTDLVKMHPNASEYYYKLAVAQVQAGEYDQATQTYDLVEQKFGFNEDMSLNKIQLFEKIKNYTAAELEIQKLIKRNPATPQNYDMLGNLYELEGKTDKAFEMYQKMEETSPHDPMVHLSLADYYRTKHNNRKSFDELELAFKEPSLEVDTKIRILLSFYGVSSGYDTLNAEGLKLCQIMVETNPAEPKAHRMYGDFLERSNDLKAAREQYVLTIQEDSSKYTNWSKLLNIDMFLNDYSAIANTTKSAMTLFPNYPQLYLMNGMANLELKKNDDAISSLEKGVSYVLDDSVMQGQFYSYMGEIYNSMKHYSSSDSAYSIALTLNPNDDGTLNNYSYYLSLRDTNLALAAQMSKRANMLKPNNANDQDTYAWILYMMNKYQEAKDWEEKALQNGGDKNSNILDHYGDILYKLGDKDRALDSWQKARDAGEKSELLERKIRDKQLYTK